MPEYSYYSQIFGAMLPCELRISETFYGSGELFLFTFFPTFRVRTLHAHRFQRNQSINQFIILLTTSAGLRWVLLTLQHQTHSRNRPTATEEKKSVLYFGVISVVGTILGYH